MVIFGKDLIKMNKKNFLPSVVAAILFLCLAAAAIATTIKFIMWLF